MAINTELQWASEGGLKQSAPQRIRDKGYTTSDGTNTGTPEYPILQWDNWFRYQVGKSTNENIARLDNLSASDVAYQFIIEDGSNVIQNNPYDTFTNVLGAASSDGTDTTLASATSNATDPVANFMPVTNQLVTSSQDEYLQAFMGDLYMIYAGSHIDTAATTHPEYIYGMNDVADLTSIPNDTSIPVLKYDSISGQYHPDYRIMSQDLLPGSDINDTLLGVYQLGVELFVVYGTDIFETKNASTFLLVRYNMATKSKLGERTISYAPTSPGGSFAQKSLNQDRAWVCMDVAVSPDKTKLAMYLPTFWTNQQNYLNTEAYLTMAMFVVDISNNTLNYSDTLGRNWDWSNTPSRWGERGVALVRTALHFRDNNTVDVVSSTPKADGGGPDSEPSGMWQHQKFSLSGLIATHEITNDLSAAVDASSPLINLAAEENVDARGLGVAFNPAGDEFVLITPETTGTSDSAMVLNRFSVADSPALLATNDSAITQATVIGGANASVSYYRYSNPVYDNFGRIWSVGNCRNTNAAVTALVSIMPADFTSTSTVETIYADDVPGVTGGTNQYDGRIMTLVCAHANYNFLLGGSGVTGGANIGYFTRALKSGGNSLVTSSNIQAYNPDTIVGKLDKVPLADSALQYMRRAEFVPRSGVFDNNGNMALWFDPTLSSGFTITMNFVGLSGSATTVPISWNGNLNNTMNDTVATLMTKEYINYAVRFGEYGIYIKTDYAKANATQKELASQLSLTTNNSLVEGGEIVLQAMSGNILDQIDRKIAYIVDYDVIGTALSTSFPDITFKQYDTYVTSVTNVQQALDAVFKLAQDLETLEAYGAAAPTDFTTYVHSVFPATRHEELDINLTANTPYTVTHNLDKKFVIASVYSESTNTSENATVVLVDEDNCTVEVSVTGNYNIVVVR